MKHLLLILSLFVSSIMMAGEVTEQEALQKAQRFMQGKKFQQKTLHRAASTTFSQGTFYVFNADYQEGYVIVSADDRTEAILGYAEQGHLNMTNLPVNVRQWLEGYAAEIKALDSQLEASQTPRRVCGAPIAPLVTTRWNQGSPYNLMCPYDGDDRCVTGCVATAMAQVMYYHKWPQAETAAIPEYTTYSQKISVDALPATTFKWDNMQDEYGYYDTGEAADAVAELMRYCGQAVEMDYTRNESGANVGASHMIKYFGYSKTAQDVSRSDYSSQAWEKMMYDELKDGRPILYSGFSGTGGHQFVIDGYDDKGLFHVNWGWGGGSDGYFVLSVLNPDGRGIGGGTSRNGYTLWQDAVIGLQPDHGEAPVALPWIYSYYDINPATFTRTSASANFNVQVWDWLYYWGDEDLTIDLAWALYKDGERIKLFDVTENATVSCTGTGTSVCTTLAFGAGLADGTYELSVVYRNPGGTEWKKTVAGWTTSLLAVISGNSLTLKFAEAITNAVQVNSVELAGDKKTGRPMKAVVNWTNNGNDYATPFYLWLSSETEYVGAVCSYVDPGQTGDVEVNFAPASAGAITVTVTTNIKYNSETDSYYYENSDVVWQDNMNVEASTPQNLEVSIAIAGEKNGTIESTTIDATVSFKNSGEDAYDDKVIIRIVPIDDNWNYLGEWTEVIRDLSLAPGASTEVTAQFPNLMKEQKYYMQVYYYSADNQGVGYAEWGNSKTVKVGTVLLKQELQVTTLVTNANPDKTIPGTVMKLEITMQNTGTNNYDDWIDVNVFYADDDGYGHFVKELRFKAQVPAGQTKVVTYEVPNLEIGTTYTCALYYYSENQYKWGCQTDWFTMITPTGIVAIPLESADLSGKVYDLQGHRLNVSRYDDLKSGLYIINGRKVVKK